MISIISPHSDINNIRNLVKQEKATAVNIKSNTNRKSVVVTLRKLSSTLKAIDTIPENGIALFANEDEVIVLYPPRKVKSFIYKCSKRFIFEPIVELYEEPQELYGLMRIQGEKCTIHTINEYFEVKTINCKTARIQKRQKKGGQSQNRIQRLRVETINNYLKSIQEKALAAYTKDGLPIIKALVLCGPGQKKEQLVPYLKKKLGINCYVYPVDYPTTSLHNSLSQIELTSVKQMIHIESKSSDETHIKTLLELIERNPDVLVFGKDNIDEAQKSKELLCVYSNRQMPYHTIKVNHHLMDSFNGCIGVRYY